MTILANLSDRDDPDATGDIVQGPSETLDIGGMTNGR
jgi:hypothetical protein